MQEKGIVILDFGSQYTQLIAKSIRRLNVFSEILACTAPREEILKNKPGGIILSGGPSSVFDRDAPILPEFVLGLNLPILGICYGMQLAARAMGAEVKQFGSGEYGFTLIKTMKDNPLFKRTPAEQQVWMSHRDKIAGRVPGMEVIASSDNCGIAAFAFSEKHIYGVQFHPEVRHTSCGQTILENFIFEICMCPADWKAENMIEQKISEIKIAAGNKPVICGVSGGVDSSVTAVLASRAVGKNLFCVFVDNGLLRSNEKENVEKLLNKHLEVKLHVVDARRRFLECLEGILDPEEKRKRIGSLFIDIFTDVSKQAGPFEYLAQGTLYPDRIESTSTFGPSDVIKTHHNVGGLPDKMNFKLIEPLAFLFKDEVRALGRAAGLPEELLGRHPFPGPGLAVRVIGEVTESKLEILRKADKIFIDGLKEWKLYDKIWQAGAVLLPVKSVGVMGDCRTYNSVIALRAVNSTDGMTADWARLGDDFLAAMSSRIINSIEGINRVVYDISTKPPSTIEWE